MALYIKDSETSRLLEQYADQVGMTKTAALRELLRKEMSASEREKNADARYRSVLDLIGPKRESGPAAPIPKAQFDSLYEYLDSLERKCRFTEKKIGRKREDRLMVVDTSVLVAIVRGEEDAEKLALRLTHTRERPRISSVSIVEAGLVLSEEEFGTFAELIRRVDMEVVEFSPAMAFAAVQAAKKYGKGRKTSKAQLNFGDCCCYGTARIFYMPLLFRGDDFVHTDIERVE